MTAAPLLNPLQRVPRHVLRRDVMPRDAVRALLDWTIAQEARFAPSRLAGGETAPDYRRTWSFPKNEPQPWRAPFLERMLALAPGLMADLGLEPHPIATMTADLVVCRDGGFVRRHVDPGIGDQREARQRMLPIVYYFHREPQGFSGGEFRLYPPSAPPEDAPQYAEIAPEPNSLVAFASWMPHEVMPVTVPSGTHADSRFSLNLWAWR